MNTNDEDRKCSLMHNGDGVFWSRCCSQSHPLDSLSRERLEMQPRVSSRRTRGASRLVSTPLHHSVEHDSRLHVKSYRRRTSDTMAAEATKSTSEHVLKMRAFLPITLSSQHDTRTANSVMRERPKSIWHSTRDLHIS